MVICFLMAKKTDIKRILLETLPELVKLLDPYLSGVRSVIDIGTGSSIPIHFFADRYPAVKFTTVDIVDHRQEKKLPFVLYDGKKLPFGDKEFDVSVLNETLHHTEDPERVLSESKRVSGAVYVVEHFGKPGIASHELITGEKTTLQALGLDTGIYRPFTESTLHGLFEKEKLEVELILKLPYHGQRKIEKYFFKLIG